MISAKRYAWLEKRGTEFAVLDGSEHGLGHLLDPLALDADDDVGIDADRKEARAWIKQAWSYLLAPTLDQPIPDLPFLDLPSLSRISVSSPHVLKPFTDAQRNRPVSERTRPGNFLLSATLDYLGQPARVNRNRFQLNSSLHESVLAVAR